MANQAKLDRFYLDLAYRAAAESHAVRMKVGAFIVKNNNVLSFGWNGTPEGEDNCCEITMPDGTLVTKPSVKHAELNAFFKLIRHGCSIPCDGATLYVTLSPCPNCVSMIVSAGIKRVVYGEEYRIPDGIQMLRDKNIIVDHLPLGEINA